MSEAALPKGWRHCRLDELGFVGRGKSRHRPRNDAALYGGDFPFVQTADIMGCDLYIRGYSKTYNENGLAQSKLWSEETLCMTIAGANTAETAILTFPACFPDSIVGFIPGDSKSDIRYIKYALDTMKLKFLSVTRGATQDNLSLTKLLSFPLPTPPLDVQRRIASILSTYDDLIENNTRRIAILEEMAQRLYQEWFVRFRFPGHEKVKLVDTELGKIPRGWEVTKLGDHLKALESGKRPAGGVGELQSGIPSVGAENVRGIGRHNYHSEKYVPLEFFRSMRKGQVKDRDVALYKDGAYIGRSTYFRDDFPHREFCVNEHVFLLRSTGIELTQNSLYLWLNEHETVEAIRASNANAAQPGINQKSVKGLRLIIPDTKTSNRFDKLIDPYMALIVSLAKQNNKLRTSRDLLLPKLISGEIDVSTLPATEESAAA